MRGAMIDPADTGALGGRAAMVTRIQSPKYGAGPPRFRSIACLEGFRTRRRISNNDIDGFAEPRC